MQEVYSPHNIEKIVQDHWLKNKTFTVTIDYNREKYYCLSMLPYPSGKLHMGHVRNYTIGDVISRYQRMLGKNVLQPMGWDAFGLPAEQAAITNNIPPKQWTYSNINYMKHQLQSLGFAYDWNRELITCQPQYYKWEQWFFTVLYKKGLVYKKNALVNWCPYHKTVLANEQVINNCCWRCNIPIKYKKIPQWFIKITNYADQLLEGLNQLEYWPEKIKTMQRNWIGKSSGISVNFNVINNDNITITTHITRLDIFMGITYLTISIDHPITLKIAKSNLDIMQFIQKHSNTVMTIHNNNIIPNICRGIFTNINAIHPITNDILPVWISNTVVRFESNGIGSNASCPAHNQQDWEFAHRYNLPIKTVIKYLDGTVPNITKKAMTKYGILFNSNHFNELHSEYASNIIATFLIKKGIAKYKILYRLKDWGISRQRYWGVPIPMVTTQYGIIQPIPITQLPVVLPNNIHSTDYNKNHIHSLKKNKNWIQTTYKNEIAFRDTDTFDTFMESSWYYARYTCPHYHSGMLDSNAANYWLPIDQYIGGIEHAIMHLLYFRFYHKLMRDVGLVLSDEPAVRLLCQGMILSDAFYYLLNNGQKKWVSPTNTIITRNKQGNIIQVTDTKGNHLIYAGMCKMSKSKNNGIDPSTLIQRYGADSIRFFIMFAAPAHATLEWKESGIEGAYRFLKRIWNMTYKHIQAGPIKSLNIHILNDQQKNIRCNVHKTIIEVTDDIDRRQSFNTALARIMKLVNILYHIRNVNEQDRAILQESLLIIIRLLYPFTPHISFILWKELGNIQDIDHAKWPIVDHQAIINNKVIIIVQINGKMRKKIFVPLNNNKSMIYEIVKKETTLNKFLTKKITKIIYIQNKIINFLTE